MTDALRQPVVEPPVEPPPAPTPKRHSGRRLFWLITLFVLACAALWTFLYAGAPVRSYARTRIESELRALLQGQVHLDHVSELSAGGIVAEGVTVIDPAGRTVLRAKRIELGLSPLSLLRNSLRFTHGKLSDVRIHALRSDAAAVTLFDALTPKESGTPGPPSSFVTAFEHIHVERGLVYGSVQGFSNFELHGLDARGQIVAGNGLHVSVTRVRGQLVRPFSQPMTIDHATTQLETGPFRVTSNARVTLNEDHIRARLVYTTPDNAPDALELVLELAPASSDILRELKLGIAESLISKLEGFVHLNGPSTALRFSAALRTDAGPIVVSGAMPDAAPVTVHVETERLDLALLLAYFPPISVKLSVDAIAPASGPILIEGHAPWLEVLGVGLQDAEVHGRYLDGRLDVDAAHVQYAGGRFDTSGWVDENADFRLRVRSAVPNTARDPTLRRVGVSTALRTDLVLSKRGTELAGEGSLGLDYFSYSGVSIGKLDVQGSVSASEENLMRPRVKLTGKANALGFEGYAISTLDFSVRGDRGRYQNDLTARDESGRSARAHVGLELIGEKVRLVANPFELSVLGREPWRTNADVVFAPDGIEFRNVLLTNGPQRLEVAGHYSYAKAYRVEGTLQSFDLGGLRELLGIDLADLDGTVDGKLALSGVPNQPRIDAQGSLKDGQFLGMTGLTVLLSLVFVEGRFDLESEIVLPDGSRLAVYAGGEPGTYGSWTNQIAKGNYQFGLDFERVPFEVTRPWLEWLGMEPPAGNISAMVRGAGTFDAPELELTSRVEGVQVGEWPALDIDVSLDHDGEKLDLRSFEIADSHGVLLGAAGSVNATLSELLAVNDLRASLDKRPFDVALRWPARKLQELPAPLQIAVPLSVSGELRAEQTPKGPRVELNAHAGWPGGKDGLGACSLVRRPDLALVASAIGDHTTGTLVAKLDQELLANAELEADTPVTDWITGKRALSLPRTAFSMRAATATSEEVPLLCERMAGPLRVNVSAKDIFADPPDMRFSIESKALQLVPHASQRPRLGALRDAHTTGRAFALKIEGGVEHEQVSFIAAIDQGKGARLDIFGAIPRAALRKDRPANVQPAEARVRLTKFELAPILIALPLSSRISGTLDGDTRIAYGFDDEKLQLEGLVRLSAGKVAIAPLGQELSGVKATLTMRGNWLRIDDLEARDFEGLVRSEGNIVFERATKIRTDLSLRLRDFPVRREGAQVSKLTGRLRFRAEVDAERTRSELLVNELRVNLPNDLGQGLQDLDLHTDIVVKGQAPEPPPEHPYIFEVHFVAKNPPFRVQRTGLNADVVADLAVRYEEPLLTIQGSAELKRGNFELYGKRFELQESRMAFDGSDQLDPLVSLYAVHKIGGDEIGVRVEGRLSAPKVSFTHSDPTITDTGAIIAELLGARSDDTSKQTRDATGAAAGFLAGATAGLLTEEVRKEFGGAIPVLSIESSNQSFKGARIRAGVQLDNLIEKRLGPLRHVVRGAYVEGFVAPGADPNAVNQNATPQSRGGGLLELRFPDDIVGTVEYRPIQNWRLDVAWEP